MRLTFEDMTKEVNVFYLEKMFEVNPFEKLTSEHQEELEYEPECKF